MSFGKERDGIHRQQLSITGTTAQSSGNHLPSLDSSQAKLLQLDISRYNPSPFDNQEDFYAPIRRAAGKKPSSSQLKVSPSPFPNLHLIFSDQVLQSIAAPGYKHSPVNKPPAHRPLRNREDQ